MQRGPQTVSDHFACGNRRPRPSETVGPSRVLFASAEPRGRYAVSINRIRRLELDRDALEAVMSGNARRVFRIS